MVDMAFDTIPRLGTTVADAAQLLSVSKASLYRAIARGDVPAYRLGRRLVVPVVVLERLLDVPCRGGGGGPAVEPSAFSSP
jgi:excisionase family DNA binding protein